jgi:hypothetical protein
VTGRYACARHALETAEPVYATASPVRRWLLIEQAGPWGRDAVLESRIDPTTGGALKARAAALGARLLLIRTHGNDVSPTTRVVVAVSRQAGGFAEAFEVGGPADVLDLDLSPLAEERPSGGTGLDRPLFLVCTNGRHDACCAEYGRPLARALSAAHPEATWECSHIGGDRFAGNVVCLPEGVYYGRVGPLEAPRVAAAHLAGRIDLAHYRGRSCHSFVVQAADYLVRRALALDRLDDLRAERRESLDVGVHRVTLAVRDGRRVRAEVRVTPDPEPRRLTCQALRPAPADAGYWFEEWPGKSLASGLMTVAALLTATAASPKPTEMRSTLPW